MATKKKRRPTKKKKVTEQHDFTVTTTTDVAGAPEETEKTVNAPDAEQAVRKATTGDPKKGQYDSVKIEKGQPGAGGPGTASQTQPKTTAATQGMAGYESVDYPYNIGLPKTYLPLVEALTKLKKIRESLSIHTRYGRIHITVPNFEVMENLMTELGKKSRGRTAVKGMAGIVMNGITESVKK